MVILLEVIFVASFKWFQRSRQLFQQTTEMAMNIFGTKVTRNHVPFPNKMRNSRIFTKIKARSSLKAVTNVLTLNPPSLMTLLMEYMVLLHPETIPSMIFLIPLLIVWPIASRKVKISVEKYEKSSYKMTDRPWRLMAALFRTAKSHEPRAIKSFPTNKISYQQIMG